jgi:hypothetical protein
VALAILELRDLDDASARFRIDTGTNPWFTIRFGRGSRGQAGFAQIDGVVAETPLRRNEKAGLLDTTLNVRVPVPPPRGERAFAQLLTFRTQDRAGPALSRVVHVAGTPDAEAVPEYDFSLPQVAAMSAVATEPFQRTRPVACRTHAEQLTAPALGDLLTEVMRVAGPLVLGLLQQPAAGGTAPAAGGTAPAAGSGGTTPAPPQLLGIIEAILRHIPGLSGFSGQQSLFVAPPRNRFGERRALSQPFVFGIDDALIGAAIGQVIQILPALANAAGQKRVQLQANQNKLVSDIISDVNRRMLLQQILDAQRASAGSTGQPDLSALAALLEQAGAQPTTPAPAPAATPPTAPVAPALAPPATGQSLSLSATPTDGAPAARATATFVTAPALPFNGREHLLLAKGRQISLDVKLVVGEPVPAKPLPKAIVSVVVKRASDQSVIAEKVVKQRDLAAGASVSVVFSPEDLQNAPSAEPLSLLAQIRWRTGSGRVMHAVGSSEAVLVDQFFVKARGSALGPERELTDMERYRAFWNKAWESPALDAAAEERKLLWALDATLKYSVLIVGKESSNGLMETRFLAGTEGPSGVTARTQGRMKSGIELSVDELNKLASLWDASQPLDEAHLAPLRGADVLSAVGGEIVQRVQLQGKAAERGLLWLVPVLSPVEFTLGTVQTADERGQVTAVAEENVRLPLPVAVRVLGLKSGEVDSVDEPAEEGAAPAYAFAGFRIDLNEKIALTPAGGGASPAAAVATPPPPAAPEAAPPPPALAEATPALEPDHG